MLKSIPSLIIAYVILACTYLRIFRSQRTRLSVEKSIYERFSRKKLRSAHRLSCRHENSKGVDVSFAQAIAQYPHHSPNRNVHRKTRSTDYNLHQFVTSKILVERTFEFWYEELTGEYVRESGEDPCSEDDVHCNGQGMGDQDRLQGSRMENDKALLLVC